MISRIRRYFTARREFADRVDIETTAYLDVMPPAEAWRTARETERNRPQDGTLWYEVRQEIYRRTGYGGPADTATRFLED